MRAKLFETLIWWRRRPRTNRKGLIWYVQFGIWLKGFTNWIFFVFFVCVCVYACFTLIAMLLFTQQHSTRSFFFWAIFSPLDHIPTYANGLLWPSQSWYYQYILWPKDSYTHIEAVMWKLQVRWVASKFDACHLSVCFAFFSLLNRVGDFHPQPLRCPFIMLFFLLRV